MHEKQTETGFQNETHREESTVETNPTARDASEGKNEALQRSQIQTLNDLFRTTFIGGKIVVTQGVHALGETVMQAIMKKVQLFKDFTKDNDPYGEHDFGIISYNGESVYWKIDYYDKSLRGGSEDPTDPTITTRVLTIMHRSEY